MDHPSRNMRNSGAQSAFNCGRLTQGVSGENFSVLLRDHSGDILERGFRGEFYMLLRDHSGDILVKLLSEKSA